MEQKTKPDPGPARCQQLELSKEHKTAIESRNSLHQFDLMIVIIDAALSGGVSFSLEPAHIQDLNAIVTIDTVTCPGEFRDGHVEITNSSHVCAHPDVIPGGRYGYGGTVEIVRPPE